MKTEAFFLCVLLLRFPSHFYADEHKVSLQDHGDKIMINVGVIVDVGSWVGKVVKSSIAMAASDFYNQYGGYRTKIALHVRDSKGDSLQCIAAALDLLENVEVHAIIIPKISNEELFLARLVEKANVPLLSLSSTPSSNEHPFLIQLAPDENNQFHGISAFLEAFKWRRFAFLYEDTADARQAQTYIHDILQENHLVDAYETALSLQATDDQIITELHKVMMKEVSIILVHLSPSLASQVFINAKMLGMMTKGFGWIVTSKTMNLLDSLDSSVYDSMQGVIGFKSYVSESGKIQNLSLRWRREFQQTESDVEMREFNMFGVWAYNAAWVLAEAIESAGMEHSQNWAEGEGLKQLDLARLRVSNIGSVILSKIRSSKFRKSVGKFQLPDNYEILNVIGRMERRVGFWKSAYGLKKEINPTINSSSNILDTIIWPGFSSTAPESWLVQMNGKSFRVGIPANGRFPELVHLYHDQQRNITTLSGFCIDVFRAAVDRLKYEISFEYIPFYNQYGSYSDLVHQVHIKNFDAAVGDITILSNRSKYVDFTLPYTESGLGVVVKLDDQDPWFFLKPLHPDLWITSACFFLLTGFIVWLVEHPINEEFQGPPAQQIGTALWFAASTLVYAHRERLQSNVSRFVVAIWLFVVLILTSSYTAKLSSLLTVEQINLSKSDYIGYSANSFIQASSMSNLNFKDNRLKPFQSPEDYDKALRQGRKKGGVDAILDELPYLKIFVAKYPRDYAIIESSMLTSGFGFAFPKGSPLVHDISRAIAELREEGTLLHMEKKWFSSQLSPLSQDTEPPSNPNTLSRDNFFGLFLLSGISKSIAILIFLIFLLRKKLSINYYMFAVLARGKLILILRGPGVVQFQHNHSCRGRSVVVHGIVSQLIKTKRTNCRLWSRKERHVPTTTAPGPPRRTATTWRCKTSIHVTAVDGVVNVNSFFTVALFIGFSLTVPEAETAGTRAECTASRETVRELIVLEVISFSFFLFSSLVAQSLKLGINLVNCLDAKDSNKADIDARLLKYGLVGSAIGSVVGCFFLTVSIAYFIQVKLGVLSCGGKTVWSIVTLSLGVGSGLVVYVTTSAYALIFL